jgi:hypothetical protein
MRGKVLKKKEIIDHEDGRRDNNCDANLSETDYKGNAANCGMGVREIKTAKDFFALDVAQKTRACKSLRHRHGIYDTTVPRIMNDDSFQAKLDAHQNASKGKCMVCMEPIGSIKLQVKSNLVYRQQKGEVRLYYE